MSKKTFKTIWNSIFYVSALVTFVTLLTYYNEIQTYFTLFGQIVLIVSVLLVLISKLVLDYGR